MILSQLKILFKKELSSVYPEDEIYSFYYLLTEDRLGLSRAETALQSTLALSYSDTSYFLDVLKELAKERPIQYILGKTTFYGLDFSVNEDVLIPRPETEELVDWILKDLAVQNKTNSQLNIIDIGTGSGCIAIALAYHLPNAKVYALDVSPEALALARINAAANKTSIETIQADIFDLSEIKDTNDQLLTFDIMVSNPPYVLENEKEEIKANVLFYEPHLALFVNDTNPLLFYEKIAQLARDHLKKQGQLFFEINQYLGHESQDLLQKKNYLGIELKKDLFGNDRMIKACIS